MHGTYNRGHGLGQDKRLVLMFYVFNVEII